MENIIQDLEQKISDLENKREDSIEIIKCISILNKEREYYQLLVKHSGIIPKMDCEIERLFEKKAIYERLLKDYNDSGFGEYQIIINEHISDEDD
jgi:hypothetical protein